MIKTQLEGVKGLWPEELPNILWAYRTTARTPIGETPFWLTFGTEAIIPVEIGVTSWRTNHHDENGNDNQLRLNLDLLDEARDQAEAKTRAYQQRMAHYHDRRVKHRGIQSGGPSAEKSDPRNKRPNLRKVGTYMGRACSSIAACPLWRNQLLHYTLATSPYTKSPSAKHLELADMATSVDDLAVPS